MASPIIEALTGMERPPQFIRIERQIPLDIGSPGNASVDFVVHEKDEFGTTLRVTEIRPGGSDTPQNGSPRAGNTPIIIPSPSA